MSILLSHCTLVNWDGSVLSDAYLGIREDRISYLGKEKPVDAYTEEKDLRGAIVTPGFINGHCHTSMVLLRGLGSGQNLQTWLFDTIFPVEDRLTAESIRAGSALALLEMLASGITSFSDMYFYPRETAELVLQSGIKANLSRCVQEFNPEGKPEDNTQIQESIALFRDWHNAGNGRIRVDFCIHAEYTIQESTVRYYSALCNENHGRMHLHLSETVSENEGCLARHGKTPAAWFASLGTFDSPTAAAHCVHLTEEDFAILQQYRVSPIHNPSSNMKLGSGFAPIRKMLDRGLNVTLGTDGAASNNNLNFLEEMHLASLIHNGAAQDPTVIQPKEILRMATRNGALLQGREDTGTLSVGSKADLCAVSVDAPHMVPNLDPVALLCYSAQASDVVLTMVDGKILYDHGEFTTLDKEKILYEAHAAAKKLLS